MEIGQLGGRIRWFITVSRTQVLGLFSNENGLRSICQILILSECKGNIVSQDEETNPYHLAD